MSKNTSALIKFYPLGGIGQIGSNMTMVEIGHQKILIDAGILFPYENFFDIDFLIPDLEALSRHSLKPDILWITHGHEDHIGAIYQVVKAFPDIEIFAPRFSANLMRKKLEFQKTTHPISVYQDSFSLEVGDFTLEPIHVNHSIPDTFGLLIHSVRHSFSAFFASDFKIDDRSPYERPFDFLKLRLKTASLQKRILFADSTNIESKNKNTPSEQDVFMALDAILSKTESRVFATLFSSNVHRIHSFLILAEKYQYKVVPHGRSMIGYIKSATEEGLLPNFDHIIKSADSCHNSEENLLILLSGCQGDFLGTFRRVAMSEDSTFKPRKSDHFIISSKAIPGNEKKISLLLNKLAEIDCNIHTADQSCIHVSGHPGKNDLLKLYNEYLPTDIFPIHGETNFLRAHCRFIKNEFPQAEAHFILNNDEVSIDSNLNISIVSHEKREPLIYHGNSIILEKNKISERRKLACNGSVFLTLKLNNQQYHSFRASYLGIPEYFHKEQDKFESFLLNELQKISYKDTDESCEKIRVSIRRYFDHKLGYKPITTVHII